MQVHSTGLEPVKVFSRIDLDSTWLQTSNYIQRGFLVLTAIVVLMQIAFLKISELDFYGIYFYAIFALIFLVLFFFPVVESASVKIPKNVYQRYVIIAVLFILFTLIKIYFNSWVPHREDELYQLVGVRDFNPITTAFKQQHPPLSYIFSAAGERLFGTSMLGLRFFNHIISSFLFVQFFLVLKVFKLSNIRAIVSTFLFFLTPFVFNYSIESRPYSLGLLLGCFFIIELFLNLLFFKNLSLTVARIAAAATLLLMAIGFQAPIFICTAASYLILMLFASKVDRSKLLAIFGGLVLSLLLLIPIQKRIVEFSGQYIKSSENLSTQIYESILRIINLRIFYGFTTLQIGIIAITVFIFLIGYLR